MLKLERAVRSDGAIHVTVRDKERLITKPFAISFFIALAIHLCLMLLFHIDVFNMESGLSIFPPIQVETLLSLKESAIADTKQGVPTIRGLPPLPSPSPPSFSRPAFLTVRPAESQKAVYSSIETFNQIEKEVYEPQFNPVVRAPKTPLKIIVSGILAEYPLIFNGLESNKLSLEEIETRVIYSVLADQKTGKIFWMELKQGTANNLINKFAENLLKDMKFDIKKQLTAVSGEVEFHFQSKEDDQ